MPCAQVAQNIGVEIEGAIFAEALGQSGSHHGGGRQGQQQKQSVKPVAVPGPGRLWRQGFDERAVPFPKRSPARDRRIAVGGHSQGPPLFEGLQLLAGFEANRLAGRNGDLRPGARIAPDAGLARPYVEDSESPELDALTLAEGALHALEDGFDGHFRFRFGDARPMDHFVDDVQFDQVRLLSRKAHDRIRVIGLSSTPIRSRSIRIAAAGLLAGLAMLLISPFVPRLAADDAPQALARAARSPYDIERFIATHNEYDWAPLWQALDIHDVFLPTCTLGSESLAACSADVVSVFDPSQVIVVLRHAANAAEVYLRFIPVVGPNRFVRWRFAGHYQPKAAFFRARYRVIVFDRKPFLVINGHGANADDASSEFEEWLDLTAGELEPALHFTSKGSQETKLGIRREVAATVSSSQGALTETIRISRETAFFAEDSEGELDLGSQTAISVYTRVGPGPFIFDETQSSSPEAEISELYEDFDRALSNEDFLSRDLGALTTIARQPESREKRWLRRLLARCEDTEDKRVLVKLIEGR